MQCQYVGFRVELCSSQLGDVVGTVNKVTENRIELSQAVINGKGLPIPSFVVESQFIQKIRILSTGTGDSSDDISPKKDDNGTSKRAQRREMLRNMPNACNAYVCPNSPPLIHRSFGIAAQQANHLESPGRSNAVNPKHLDSALVRITINEKAERKQSKHTKNQTTPMKRRSRSFSEAVPSNSDVSGTESDTFNRSHAYGNRGAYLNGNRHPSSRSYGRGGCGGATSNIRGPGGRSQTTADWDRIRVEDFIDQDFDFEKNLAMFDKNAFYEMVDMREGNTRPTVPNPPPLSHLDEGPDGVGLPLIGNVRHSERTREVMGNSEDNLTLTTNTATLSSFKQRYADHVPYYHPSPKPVSDSLRDVTCVTNTTSRTQLSCATTLGQPHSRFWYSSNGLRVPILSAEDHSRMLNYLATGRDSHYQVNSGYSHEMPTLAQGFTWGRMLETAGRSLVDQLMLHIRQTNQTPQRLSHRPPTRVLVLPGGPHLSGAFCITLARLLAVRGACVLAIVPKCSSTDTPTKATGTTGSSAAIYRAELNLTLQFAPRPNQYGLEDEDEDNDGQSLDEYDEEEEAEDSAVSVAFDSVSNVHNEQDGDNDRASCFTLDQLVQRDPITDPLDYSPVHRMWLSRMPGFKLLHRPQSILKIPTNVRVDLVIVGHDSTTEMDSHVLRWLQQHQALSCLVHIMPRKNIFTESAHCNAPHRWIVELGLPVLLPNQLTEPSSTPVSMSGSPSNSHSTSHLLVDVGLSRNLVRRLTSDLKALPPYGLFDVGSVVTLRPDLSSSEPPTS